MGKNKAIGVCVSYRFIESLLLSDSLCCFCYECIDLAIIVEAVDVILELYISCYSIFFIDVIEDELSISDEVWFIFHCFDDFSS